jgi:hypothetical protein
VIDRTIADVDNGAIHNVRSIATSSDGLLTDSVVFADASAGTVVYALPNAAQAINKRVVVVNAKGGVVNVSGPIDATSVVPLAAQFDSLEVASNGAQWYRI